MKMEFIKAQIVGNDKENYHAGTDAYTQTKYVDQRVCAVPGKIPKGYEEVILYHNGLEIYQSNAINSRYCPSSTYVSYCSALLAKLYQNRYRTMFDIDTDSIFERNQLR
jgi:hypothetical protein